MKGLPSFQYPSDICAPKKFGAFAYLSLTGNEESVIFICYLKDGRYFIARSSLEIFNKPLEFGYRQDSFWRKNC
jgi:hypothetical protein